MTSTVIDRERLAVLTALEPLIGDRRLEDALQRLHTHREFYAPDVLDIGTWSSGEAALIAWAGALWSGSGQVDIAYIASSMSDRFLHAALGALAVYANRHLPAVTSLGRPVIA